jgi:hypothetical protein
MTLLSLTDVELEALFVTAQQLPIECRAAFLQDLVRAFALLQPDGNTTVLIDRLARMHFAKCMAIMSPGDHYGDSELGTAGARVGVVD